MARDWDYPRPLDMRPYGDGYRPHTAPSDPGPPPHRGSSGSKPATIDAKLDRIIELLERIEAGQRRSA